MRFRSGDFVEIALEEGLSRDLVMCFDVLIHQPDYASYSDFVKTLVRATKNLGIVSGYILPPRPEKDFEVRSRFITNR